MRSFTFFALALAGIGAVADDASAFGRRRRGNDCCQTTAPTQCCGGTGYVGTNYNAPCCGGVASAPAYTSPYYGTSGGACCGETGVVYGGARGGIRAGRGYGTTATYYYPSGTYTGEVRQAGYNAPYPMPGVVPATGNNVVPPASPPGSLPGTNPPIPNPMPDR